MNTDTQNENRSPLATGSPAPLAASQASLPTSEPGLFARPDVLDLLKAQFAKFNELSDVGFSNMEGADSVEFGRAEGEYVAFAHAAAMTKEIIQQIEHAREPNGRAGRANAEVRHGAKDADLD